MRRLIILLIILSIGSIASAATTCSSTLLVRAIESHLVIHVKFNDNKEEYGVAVSATEDTATLQDVYGEEHTVACSGIQTIQLAEVKTVEIKPAAVGHSLEFNLLGKQKLSCVLLQLQEDEVTITQGERPIVLDRRFITDVDGEPAGQKHNRHFLVGIGVAAGAFFAVVIGVFASMGSDY